MYSDACDASQSATLPISSGTGEGDQSMPPTADEGEQDYPLDKKRIRRPIQKVGAEAGQESQIRLPARVKEALNLQEKHNRVWSLHFRSDSLISGRRFRGLKSRDDFYRKAIAMEAELPGPLGWRTF